MIFTLFLYEETYVAVKIAILGKIGKIYGINLEFEIEKNTVCVKNHIHKKRNGSVNFLTLNRKNVHGKNPPKTIGIKNQIGWERL